MNQKKIPTILGIIIIVIIAVTIGMFTWKIEESNEQIVSQMPNVISQKNQETQESGDNQKLESTESTSWLTFKNDKYNFEIQYPSNFLFDENLMDGPEYSINFGPSYKDTFGKEHSVRKATRNFEMSIYKNKNDVDSLIKKGNEVRVAVEQTSKLVGTEKIGALSAKIIKACDIGGNCDKIIYFVHDKYIYSVYMQNYFTLKNEVDKNNFDQMITSFKFLPKQ